MQKITKILSTITFVSTALFMSSASAFAASSPNCGAVPCIDATLIAGWVNKITNFIGPFLIFVTVIIMIYGGYMWMTAAGDPGKVKQAQGTLTWGVIGLIFSLLIVVIANVVINFITT